MVGESDITQINSYYPFGLNMNGNFNGAAGSNKYQYNGKEWNDDFGLGWNDYGARFYDPALARWSVIDMKSEKYFSISPFVYVANMPTKAIDPDGKEIVVPNKDDRGRVLEMINSKSAGTFAFNDEGKLYQKNAENEKKEGSTYYRDKLVAAMGSDYKIEIEIHEKVKLPAFSEGGKGNKLIKNVGTERDLAQSGEGLTFGDKFTDQLVVISGKECLLVKDTDGKPLEDKPADILLHELVGHAIPRILGVGSGNAVKNENRARSQIGDKKQREADEKHIETYQN